MPVKHAIASTHHIHRYLPVLAVIAVLSVASGCGRRAQSAERFFDYGTGKVNLERITYITPRIKIGIDDFPLTEAGIETVIEHLRNGRWTYFDVQAHIFFDEFLWRVYRSATFDPENNPLTPKEIDILERELKAARQRFLAIR